MTTPTDKEWRLLYDAAIAFKNIEPWSAIFENQLFVVVDPETKIEGFCCVMGTQGEHLALSVYLGREGLKSYQKMFDLHEDNMWHPQYMKTLMGQNCLMVSFENRNQIDHRDYNQIKKLGYSFRGKNAWPKFNEHCSGFLPVSLESGWQCRFLTCAINQAIEIVKLVKQKRLMLPDWNQDNFTCRQQNNELEWETTTISTGWLLEKNYSESYFENDILAHKIKKVAKKPISFECIQFLLPDPVQKTTTDRPFFPLITAMIERDNGNVVFAEMTDSSLESKEEILTKLSRFFASEIQFRPQKILIDDDDLQGLLQDICQKCEIELERNQQIDFAYDFMNHVLDHSDEEFEEDDIELNEEVDLMLSTTRQICEIIVSSDSLCKNFTPNVRSHFINVI
ncbi:MAG: DUF7309 domain-containing protein, partial [Turicibacter sp.]